jgi:hypothetical protein
VSTVLGVALKLWPVPLVVAIGLIVMLAVQRFGVTMGA